MKRQEAEAILNRFIEECGDAVPAQRDVQPVLDRVWERLEGKGSDFVSVRAPAAPAWPLRFVWAVGTLVAAVLVSTVVWRSGPPFSVAVNTANAVGDFFSRSSTEKAGETLQLGGPQDVFELATVKLVDSSSELAKAANTEAEMQLRFFGCLGGYMGRAQVSPGRLTIPGSTVLTLVIVAYGQECTLVEGGPSWARSGEYYEIQALIPAGTPSYTQDDLMKGNAPRLQRMLQSLLADRFRLVLRRELRDMDVYTLTVANRGKLTLSPDETRPVPASFPSIAGLPTPPLRRGQMLALMGGAEVQMTGHATSISALAKDLRQYAGRIVIDKTGLDGVFDIDLKFARDPSTTPLPPARSPEIPPPPGALPPAPPMPGSPLRIALEEQLGLKLESTKMPIEVLIIESVERPVEN